jgi:hypothetical protein
MKGNKFRGFLELSGGALLAMALIVICSLKVYANSVPGLMVERAVPLLPPATPIAIDDWVIYLLAGLVVVALVVVVTVLLLRRKKTAKRPARLGMPPTTPPPMRPAIATPPGVTPQPTQPIAAAAPQPFQPVTAGTPRLIMPDNTEVPLSEGLRYMGRGDFERMVPPDRADYISRQHLAVGFASGSYYVEDAGSGNGTKLNGRDLKGKGSQWLKDGDQIDVGGVAIFVFKTS